MINNTILILLLISLYPYLRAAIEQIIKDLAISVTWIIVQIIKIIKYLFK